MVQSTHRMCKYEACFDVDILTVATFFQNRKCATQTKNKMK